MNQQPVILCVDDEARNLSLLKAVLTPRGYHVVLAHDPGGGGEVCRHVRG